jgi:flagellar protein FlaJ
MEKERKVVLVSLLMAVLLISIFAFLTQDIGIIINVSVIALFVLIIPLFLIRYTHFLWLKSVEKQFPSFIRDVAGFKRSGITLAEAIKMASKNNYGKLTPEVQKLSNRLSWGVHFLRALDIFSKSFKGSKIIREALAILKEAYLSGGDISVTLDSLAKDMVTLKEIEEERKSIVQQHVMIMYGIFYMFTAISIAIMLVLVPMMGQAQGIGGGEVSAMGMSFSSPCSGFNMFPCDLFNIVCTSFAVTSEIGCYYFSLFFFILLIQAIFMGLIAGQLGENSIIAGVKHSLIMLASLFVIFTFLMRIGFLAI